MTTPFRRRPDDDDDDERPDSLRRPSRPADDDDDNPPQRAGSSGWVAPRFNADRSPARDTGSNDDFGFIKDRIDRRPGSPPKDDDKDEDGSGLGGFMRRSKKPEDEPPARPPMRSPAPIGDRRSSPLSKDDDKEEGSGLGGFLRRSKKPEDEAPRSPSRSPMSERPAAPSGRFSAPGSRDKPNADKGDDEPHKSRFGGILGRGSKDKDDKDDKSKDSSPARRSPFLGGSGDSNAPGGSSLRDSQRKPGTSPFGGTRQPIGSDDSPRPGAPSPFRDRTTSSGGDRTTSPYGDRSPGGDRTTSPYERDRTNPPGGDRTTTGNFDRPGGPQRPGGSPDRPGGPARPGMSPDRPGGSPMDRDRGPGGDRPTSPFERDRTNPPGGDRTTTGSFDRSGGSQRPGVSPDRPGAPARPGVSPDRPGGSPLDRDRAGAGRPDSLRDRDTAGGSPPSGTRDWQRREPGGGDLPPRSASQTRAFPARPGADKDEKKEEPRKSRLGGLLGRGSKDKEKDQDKKGSRPAVPARPGTAPGARSSQTTSSVRPALGGSTDVRGRSSPPPAPTPDAKRRSQLAPAAKDTDRSLPGGRKGTPEPKSRATTPPVSSRMSAKPLPGKEKGAFSLEQGLDFERKIDLIGVALLGFALVTFFAVIPSMSLGLLPEPKQGLTGALNHLLAQMFGWGKIVWPIVAGGVGIWLMRASFAERSFELNFFRIVGTAMLYACALTWLQMFQLVNDTASSVEAFKPISYDLAIKQGQGGGWLGHTLYMFLLGQLLDWGTVSVLLAWLVMSLMLTFDLSLVELWGYVARVLSVFTINDEQRARKRAAREALSTENMAVIRPGEAIVVAGAAVAAEIASTPVRSTTRQAPPATEIAPAKEEPAARGLFRRSPGAAEKTTEQPAVTETPAPAGEGGQSSPFAPRPSGTRPGPVINRRTGAPNGDSPLEPPEEDAKAGDESSSLLARRRLPHFRGATEETDAVSGAEVAAAGSAAAPKVEESADAGRRRFGGLFGRGKEESASGSADKSTADKSPVASSPTDPLVRRSSFARPTPDAAAGDVPGIPVPTRASTPTAAAAPADSAEKSENKGFGLGRFRRGPALEDAEAPSQEKEEEDGLSTLASFRRKPDATATTETAPASTGEMPAKSEESGLGLGRFRRGGNPTSPASTDTPGETPAKSEEGGLGLGRFRRGGSSATETPAVLGEAETPAKSENALSGFNRFRRKPDSEESPAASTDALTKDPLGGAPADPGEQRGRLGRFVPGLRRGSDEESETRPTDTPAVRPEKTGDTTPTVTPSRPSPFDSALRPSRTIPTPDAPRADDEDKSGSRPEIPGVRRSSGLMNLASQAAPAPLSPLRRPVFDDDAVDKLKDKAEDEDKDDDAPKEDRPGLGTLAALGAAGAVGAAALLSRRDSSDADEPPAPLRAEPGTPDPVRSPLSGLRRSEPARTPAFTLDDPLEAEIEIKPDDDAEEDEKPADELSIEDKPAQPARPDLLQRRPPFGDRPRTFDTTAPTTPPAEEAAEPVTLTPARPAGIDPLRRTPLTPPLRSSENAAPSGEKPNEIGAAAPIQAPAMLRRSPLIATDAPDTPPVKADTPPAKEETPGETVQAAPAADLPTRPAPAEISGELEVPTTPAPAIPARPTFRPAGTSGAPSSASTTPPLARPVSRPADLRPAAEIPTRPAPVAEDDEEENDFDDENFEEVEDENGSSPAAPSVLGTRDATPSNIPTGRPSVVQRTGAPEHPTLPPKPAGPPSIVKHEPAAAVAAGANAPESRSMARGKGRYEPPDYRGLLRRGDEKRINDEILLDKARVIEDTLLSFGAPGKVVEVNPGPVITQFGVEPDYVSGRQGKKMRVKVGAIARLDADLALALAAKSIRIEAPVPGKGFVGIEVPNDEVSLVGLYDIMDSPEFRRIDSKLRLALGLGVDGSPVAADLTAMPHLLIAGTTGSGKSVCVNSIIACLLLENSPQDVQFIMVDPKRVELTGYNGIPHLVAPVVVDLERIVGVLQWVQREMEERYRKFAAISARNIIDYNAKLGPDGQKIPYYVVVVDELADLMMLAPDETERLLARLAQMARATGIHLIISTQRPSVDIITGLIKANFPARIAFAVASSVDSRVILDQPGAEKLLGRGDMLYQSPDAAAPLRMQGVYVSDEEINRITSYWKAQVLQKADATGARDVLASPSRDFTLTRTALEDDDSSSRRKTAAPTAQRALWDEEEMIAGATDGESKGDDELYQEAVDLVQRQGKASISLLQRRLRIGYTRSAKMIDMMEDDGIIGPAESGSKPREVLKLKPTTPRAEKAEDAE